MTGLSQPGRNADGCTLGENVGSNRHVALDTNRRKRSERDRSDQNYHGAGMLPTPEHGGPCSPDARPQRQNQFRDGADRSDLKGMLEAEQRDRSEWERAKDLSEDAALLLPFVLALARLSAQRDASGAK